MEDREITSRMIRVTTPEGMTKDMRFTAKYDRHQDKFYVQVPHWLLIVNDDERANVYGDTPQKALHEVEEIARHYKGHLTKKRKVILLLFTGHKHGEKSGEFKRHHSTQMKLRWHVCWEFFTPGRLDRQYGVTEARPSRVDGDWININPHSWDPDDKMFQVIDWTAERENFLRSFQTSMEAALDRGVAFFRNAKRAGKMMDAAKSQKLLT